MAVDGLKLSQLYQIQGGPARISSNDLIYIVNNYVSKASDINELFTFIKSELNITDNSITLGNSNKNDIYIVAGYNELNNPNIRYSNVDKSWQFNNGNGIYKNFGSSEVSETSLSELSDVSINSLSNNQVLSFDALNNKWINSTLDKSIIGLNNVDNTSDLNKPISIATQTALNQLNSSLQSSIDQVDLKVNSKLSSSNIIQGDRITLSVDGNNITVSADVQSDVNFTAEYRDRIDALSGALIYIGSIEISNPN